MIGTRRRKSILRDDPAVLPPRRCLITLFACNYRGGSTRLHFSGGKKKNDETVRISNGQTAFICLASAVEREMGPATDMLTDIVTNGPLSKCYSLVWLS